MLKPITKLIATLGDAIDKNFTSKDEKNAALIELRRLEIELIQMENSHMSEVLKLENARLEAGEESFLKRNWRPFLFTGLAFGVIVNYIIWPMLNKVPFDFPDQLWNLINWGVGGYTTLLGMNKVVGTWKGNNILNK